MSRSEYGDRNDWIGLKMGAASVMYRLRSTVLDNQSGAAGIIVHSALLVAALTFAAKVVALLKELLISSQFGRSDDLEAFLVAFLVPGFVINVFAGAFNASMIPTFIAVRHEHGDDRAQRLLSNISIIGAGLLVGVSLLLALLSGKILPAICSGFSAEKLALTQSLFVFILPVLTIKGLASIWADTLIADKKFGIATLAPALNAVGMIVILLMWQRPADAASLVVGLLAGIVLEAIVLVRALRREGWQTLPRWRGMDGDLAEVLRQYWPAVAAGIFMSSTELVDGAMAAMLPAGSVAALSYGNKITAFLLGIGATALTTAALPHLSQLVAERKLSVVRKTLANFIAAIFAIGLLVMALFITFSETFIRVVYERGAFTSEDTRIVAQVQSALLLQLPFYVASGFTVRVIQALKANQVMMWGTVISLVLNIVLNYILMQKYGVVGIALSTSIVYMVSFLFLSFFAFRLISLEERVRG